MLKRNLCVLMTFLEAKATVSAQHHSWLTHMVFDKDEASGQLNLLPRTSKFATFQFSDFVYKSTLFKIKIMSIIKDCLVGWIGNSNSQY